MKATVDATLALKQPSPRAGNRSGPNEPQESFEKTLESARRKPREAEKPVSKKPESNPAKAEPESAEQAPAAEQAAETEPAVEAAEEQPEAPADEQPAEQGESQDHPQSENSNEDEAPLVQYCPTALQQADMEALAKSVEAGADAESGESVVHPIASKPVAAPQSANAAGVPIDPALAAVEGETAPVDAETKVQSAAFQPKAAVRASTETAAPLEGVDPAIAEAPTTESAPISPKAQVSPEHDTAAVTQKVETQSQVTKAPAPPAPPAPPPAPEAQFATQNHGGIISGIRGQLLPNGGSMTLTLDPPELGALQVLVQMRGGAMTATFQTSNDEATRLLSHSLSQLKQSLESQGISVDRIHVQQAPRDQQAGNQQDQRQENEQRWDNPSARQEQQRREMVQRMWRKLAGIEDPLDLVA